MRAIAIFIAATTGLGAVATLSAAPSAAAEEKCFDKGTLSYVDCPKPAAPVAAPAPVIAPPPAPLWGGCYVGVFAGYSRSETETSVQDTTTPAMFTDRRTSDDGTAGGLVGCQFDVANGLVLGLEVDGGGVFGGVSGSGVGAGALTLPYSTETDIDWLASARLRAGYAFDRWLPYVTGGIAFAGWSASGQMTTPGPTITSFEFDETAVGGVAGLGVDYLLTENWAFGVEGLYYFFDDDVSGPLNIPFLPPERASASLDDIFVGRVKLTYNF